MTSLVAEDTATRSALEALLDTDPDAAVAAVRTKVEQSTQGTRGFVLAGAGAVGRWVANQLRRSGANVICFADNRARLIGPEVDGIPVLAPSDAVQRHGDAPFVVTVGQNSAGLVAQLEALGARSPLPWTWLMWSHAARSLPYYDLDLPHGMIAAADDVLRVFDLLGDMESRRTLVDQVCYRLTLDSDVQAPPADMASIYAVPGICVPEPDDVYVDVGAFDGDSIAMHLGRTGGSAEHVIAIEADPAILPPLRERVADLPEEMRTRVTIHPVAVGAERGTATFRATGTLVSSMYAMPGMDDADTVTVDVATLDELLAGTGASYVKIDIEGAEPLALAGAGATLAGGRAAWAVCVYHAPEHLWTLPLQIADSGAPYRHVLRRYSQDCWEMVHYAVPAHRAIKAGRP